MSFMQPEIFDVVDAQDRVVRCALRSDVHAQGLRHRAVHVFLFNQRGELFVQKRAASKDTFPGCYDSSASGHLDSGEDYDAAAVRELGEELGLLADSKHPRGLPSDNVIVGAPFRARSGTANRGRKAAPTGTLAAMLQKHFRIDACAETGWEFVWVYCLQGAYQPVINPDEIESGRFWPVADVAELIRDNPNLCAPSFCLIFREFQQRGLIPRVNASLKSLSF